MEMEIVYSKSHGGLYLSNQAAELFITRLRDAGRYEEAEEVQRQLSRTNGTRRVCIHLPCDRADPVLVSVVKTLGASANGKGTAMKVKRIPSEWKGCYVIDEYDGLESVRFDTASYARSELKNLLTTFDQRADVKQVLEDVVDKLERC